MPRDTVLRCATEVDVPKKRDVSPTCDFYSYFLLITPFTTARGSVLGTQCLGGSVGCILTAGETEAWGHWQD